MLDDRFGIWSVEPMQAVRFIGDRVLELANVPDPTPDLGDVIIEIKASGMCGSDLHSYRAPAGSRAITTAGHEPCGVVAEVGPGVTERQARVGQRVMDHHYSGCGACIHCVDGWTQMCEDGSIVYGNTGDGAHAKYLKVPAYTLVAMPDDMSYTTGAAVSCGTGTAYGALRRLDLSGRDTIAIFGQGPVGLSATQLAVAMGARVIAVDVVAERRAMSLSFGADAAIDPAAEDAPQAIRELTHGRGTECALDCTSSADARAQAVRACRPWGRVCFVGMGGKVTLEVNEEVIKKQMTIMGSWTFSASGQAECARFVQDRGVDVDALFTHRWSLDQAAEAYELFDAGRTGKGVFLL
jgi:threonine dehydrogenase-like Zn-dependent dehydrogenase